MEFAREYETTVSIIPQHPTDQVRELTGNEIENVSGGVFWLAILVPVVAFTTGVAVGATLAKK